MTTQYSPLPPPRGTDPAEYAYGELSDLVRSMAEAQEFAYLQILHAAPARPREGMIVRADGTDWDPSAGAGIYAYINSAWVALHTGSTGSGANLSWTASTRTIASDTGSDAVITLVTSTNAGLAPAGSLNDSDKGDITVSSNGTVWTLDLKLNEIDSPTGSVNFNDQQATSFRIENRTSDPVSPTTGQIWLRTDL
jgi:hypothetical protein